MFTLAAVAARGRKDGRKPVVTDEAQTRRTFIAKGLTVREAAVCLRVGKTTLYAPLRG
jgi:DNA invertase Pin-like site-specific DNA recombinase